MRLIFSILIMFLLIPGVLGAETVSVNKKGRLVEGTKDDKKKKKESPDSIKDQMKGLPTIINSDSLSLWSKDHKFQYNGHVIVTHGDMTLACELLDGFYDEDNQIQRLVARNNVVITKGATIKGSSQRATYEKASDTMTLTENPQVEQNGNLLSADQIKIYLADNRSEAKGTVRMKVLSTEKPSLNGTPLATPPPAIAPGASTPTPTATPAKTPA